MTPSGISVSAACDAHDLVVNGDTELIHKKILFFFSF